MKSRLSAGALYLIEDTVHFDSNLHGMEGERDKIAIVI